MSRMEVGEVYQASTGALEAAKGPRLSLRRALGDFEDALAAPSLGQAAGCASRLTSVLEHLKTVWTVHVEVTEGTGGLYEEIMENTPRLANMIDRFTREHATIARALDAAVARLREVPDGDVTSDEQFRDGLVRLFADLVRHRKRGLDLVYEAYHVDIGGES
ncbi:MAG TPA: hemerythrin domain-containing protein [Actinomycetes bacterium]|nr:hemerythrin domain-containing protein [Actinomycetes bacterium]